MKCPYAPTFFRTGSCELYKSNSFQCDKNDFWACGKYRWLRDLTTD